MINTLLILLIIGPLIAAVFCYVFKTPAVRSFIVIALGSILAVSSIALYVHGPFTHSPRNLLGIPLHWLVFLADDVLLITLLVFGFIRRNIKTIIFVLIQIILLDYFEFFMIDKNHIEVTPSFYADNLSLIMVLVISIVGSLICIYAIPYMKKHEEEQGIEKSRQPQFFAFLLLILSAMNGFVLSNNIIFMYMFFEVTTLGSFMLVAHDRTEDCIKNSTRILWINCFAGLCFIIAMVWAFMIDHTINAQTLIGLGHRGGIMVTPLALLCLAGLVKAAQMPFQSWLLGAMVAPTPTSALLHSSTMVKAGVYLALRFAPGFSGTFLSDCLAISGAFTFLATSFLAVSQSNAKKLLAYSTIGNLGLIIACAGINTPEAIAAGILLIIFHAVSKGLLFLCVGDIEQHIGSRDIEVMRGLFTNMPRTTYITLLGIVSMMLPPFGVLLCKWMAIEAAASSNLIVVIMLAFGSALMVLYWTRWAGTIICSPNVEHINYEKQPFLTTFTLMFLVVAAIILSMLAPFIYIYFVAPIFSIPVFRIIIADGIFDNFKGAFSLYPVLIAFALVFLISLKASRNIRKSKKFTTSYLCGVQISNTQAFVGPMNKPANISSSNYYLSGLFGEDKLTIIFNLLSGILLVLLVGGAL